MKTKLSFLLVITFLFSSLFYFSGCGKNEQDPKKDKTVTIKSSKRICDTLKSNVKQNLNAIVFMSRYKGLIAGDHGVILKTVNGGYKWDKIGSPTGNKHLYGIAMADSHTVIAVGETGTIIRSKDGGDNWSPVTSGNVGFQKSLRTVAFYDSLRGFTAGDSGVVFATTDGGIHWKKVYSDPKQTFYGLSFNSDKIPFIVGNNGSMIKSNKWNKVTSGTTVHLKSIHFALGKSPHSHTNTGFAVGNDGIVLKTIDGGKNWSKVSSVTKKNLRGVFLTSSRLGYAVGENGTVLKFDGLNLKPLKMYTPVSLNAVANVLPTSVCVGEEGQILGYYPDSVKNGSLVTPETQDCRQWTFNLSQLDTAEQSEGGVIIYYRHFEVCTSEGVDLMGGGTFAGWSVLEGFHGRSNEFRYDPLRKWQIYLLFQDSGFVTCYLMDQWGNPHTLNSYECY